MWLLLSCGLFLLSVAGQSVLRRVMPNVGTVLAFLISGLTSACILTTLLVFFYGIDTRSIAALLVYVLQCELYIFLFTMISSSVSASILIGLRRRAMTQTEFSTMYSGRGMVEKRLDNLLSAGLLRCDFAKYSVTPKGLRLLRLFRGLRSFFRHRDRYAGVSKITWSKDLQNRGDC